MKQYQREPVFDGIPANELEFHRVRLENQLMTTDISFRPFSVTDEEESRSELGRPEGRHNRRHSLSSSNDSLEYPRHQQTEPDQFHDFASFAQNRQRDQFGVEDTPDPPRAWSYRTDDDPANHYTGGETLSTAAHHASKLTLTAGLDMGGAGGRRMKREASTSGAEYDPDRRLQDMMANVDSKLSVFDLDPSRSKFMGPASMAYDPIFENTVELDRVLESGHNAPPKRQSNPRSVRLRSPIASPITSTPASSDTETNNAPQSPARPKLSDALKHVTLSPKRPRSVPPSSMERERRRARDEDREREHERERVRTRDPPAPIPVANAGAAAAARARGHSYAPSPLRHNVRSEPQLSFAADLSYFDPQNQPTSRPTRRQQQSAAAGNGPPPTPGPATAVRHAKVAQRLHKEMDDSYHLPQHHHHHHQPPHHSKTGGANGKSGKQNNPRKSSMKTGGGGEKGLKHTYVNGYAPLFGNGSSVVHLPDVTGLTIAVESPMKQPREYYNYKGDEKGREDGGRLIRTLNAVHSKLEHLEGENAISRRRVRELELELEVAKKDVARERSRVEEHSQTIMGVANAAGKKGALGGGMGIKGRAKPASQAHVTTSAQPAASGGGGIELDLLARYEQAVSEKGALEALITSLRAHLARLTSELSSHQSLLQELRFLRDSDANALREKSDDVDRLRVQVERLAGEVEVLRGVVEEGLRERRSAREREGVTDTGSGSGEKKGGIKDARARLAAALNRVAPLTTDNLEEAEREREREEELSGIARGEEADIGMSRDETDGEDDDEDEEGSEEQDEMEDEALHPRRHRHTLHRQHHHHQQRMDATQNQTMLTNRATIAPESQTPNMPSRQQRQDAQFNVDAEAATGVGYNRTVTDHGYLSEDQVELFRPQPKPQQQQQHQKHQKQKQKGQEQKRPTNANVNANANDEEEEMNRIKEEVEERRRLSESVLARFNSEEGPGPSAAADAKKDDKRRAGDRQRQRRHDDDGADADVSVASVRSLRAKVAEPTPAAPTPAELAQAPGLGDSTSIATNHATWNTTHFGAASGAAQKERQYGAYGDEDEDEDDPVAPGSEDEGELEDMSLGEPSRTSSPNRTTRHIQHHHRRDHHRQSHPHQQQRQQQQQAGQSLRRKRSSGNLKSGAHAEAHGATATAEGTLPFPQIRGEQLERLFSSALEHDPAKCKTCIRQNRPGEAVLHNNNNNNTVVKERGTNGHVGGGGRKRGEEEWLPSRRDEVYRDTINVKGKQRSADAFGAEDEGEQNQPSQKMVQKVVDELQDDFSHYKSIYVELAQQYAIMDAVSDVPRRNLLAKHVVEVLAILEQKGDQIAALTKLMSNPSATSTVSQDRYHHQHHAKGSLKRHPTFA